MKSLLILLLSIPLSTIVTQERKPAFSQMEINHIRVATPGLFLQSKLHEIHLESLSDEDYSFPLPNGKIISPYGRNRSRHSGVDSKTHAKDTIRAAFAGVVRMSKPYSAYGNVIVIRHNTGLETVYSHQFKNFVKSGDSVQAGQPIGLTGRTGRASTEHLHFETRINGQHFNPNIIFNLEERTLRRECIRCTKNGKGIVVKTKHKK